MYTISMMPPGHAAAGYLSAALAIKISHLPLSGAETNALLAWGVFFGVIPDIDLVPFFITRRSFRLKADDSHRKYITHAPLAWLIASLAVFFLAASPFYKAFGLVMLFSSWSHFIGDGIEHGIMWLWPFSKDLLPLKKSVPDETRFAGEKLPRYYWSLLTKMYAKSATVWLEVIIIAAAIIYYIT